jgi:hypothetical protein
MINEEQLRQLAVKIEMPVDKLRDRISELLRTACDDSNDLGERCDACFWLEPYEVFPQGEVYGAPTEAEYEAFVKAVAVELGKPERYKPLAERRKFASDQHLTLEQALAGMY